MLNKAIEIATSALAGQYDKEGRPYIEHSIRVMELMDTEDEKIVAVLHDVLEDSEEILKDLAAVGFSKTVIEAVDQLTKRSNMTYFEYIEDICSNPLAVKIKTAELNDNMDINRVNKMSFKTYTLKDRCEKSKKILQEES